MTELTLAEAIACKLHFGALGYPSKAKQRVLYEAEQVLAREANKAASRIEDGICTTCWGDGFHRVSAGILSGPCKSCNGSGHVTSEPRHD